MKLVHPDFEFQVVFMENTISELVFENPGYMGKYIWELYGQTNAKEGSFVLSDKGEILDIGSLLSNKRLFQS